MESLARSLSIARGSAIFGRALEVYHRLKLRSGSVAKYSETCRMAAALKLAADGFDTRLDAAVCAKKAGVALKLFESCLEYVVATLGVEMGLVTVAAVARSCGYPAIEPVAVQILRALEDAPKDGQSAASKRTQCESRGVVVLAASVYLAFQAVGVRASLAAICAASYSHQQHVQRCSIEMRSLAGPAIEAISQDVDLAKAIKAEGRQQPRLKRLSDRDGGGPALHGKISRPQEAQAKIPRRTLSLLDTHCLADLGYASMAGATLTNTEWHSLHRFLHTSAAQGDQ